MRQFIAKENTIIEAEQFIPPLYIPTGVFNVYNLYNGPSGKSFIGYVWTANGKRLQVRHGDWIVKEPSQPVRLGEFCLPRCYSISDEVFRKKYRLFTPMDKSVDEKIGELDGLVAVIAQLRRQSEILTKWIARKNKEYADICNEVEKIKTEHK